MATDTNSIPCCIGAWLVEKRMLSENDIVKFGKDSIFVSKNVLDTIDNGIMIWKVLHLCSGMVNSGSGSRSKDIPELKQGDTKAVMNFNWFMLKDHIDRHPKIIGNRTQFTKAATLDREIVLQILLGDRAVVFDYMKGIISLFPCHYTRIEAIKARAHSKEKGQSDTYKVGRSSTDIGPTRSSRPPDGQMKEMRKTEIGKNKRTKLEINNPTFQTETQIGNHHENGNEKKATGIKRVKKKRGRSRNCSPIQEIEQITVFDRQVVRSKGDCHEPLGRIGEDNTNQSSSLTFSNGQSSGMSELLHENMIGTSRSLADVDPLNSSSSLDILSSNTPCPVFITRIDSVENNKKIMEVDGNCAQGKRNHRSSHHGNSPNLETKQITPDDPDYEQTLLSVFVDAFQKEFGYSKEESRNLLTNTISLMMFYLHTDEKRDTLSVIERNNRINNVWEYIGKNTKSLKELIVNSEDEELRYVVIHSVFASYLTASNEYHTVVAPSKMTSDSSVSFKEIYIINSGEQYGNKAVRFCRDLSKYAREITKDIFNGLTVVPGILIVKQNTLIALRGHFDEDFRESFSEVEFVKKLDEKMVMFCETMWDLTDGDRDELHEIAVRTQVMTDITNWIEDSYLKLVIIGSSLAALISQMKMDLCVFGSFDRHGNGLIDIMIFMLIILFGQVNEGQLTQENIIKESEILITAISQLLITIFRDFLASNSYESDSAPSCRDYSSVSNIFKLCSLYRSSRVSALQFTHIGCVILHIVGLDVADGCGINPLMMYTITIPFCSSEKLNRVSALFVVILALITNDIDVIVGRMLYELETLKSCKYIRLLFEVLRYMLNQRPSNCESPKLALLVVRLLTDVELVSTVNDLAKSVIMGKTRDPLDGFLSDETFKVIQGEYSNFSQLMRAVTESFTSFDIFIETIVLYQMIENRDKHLARDVLSDTWKAIRRTYFPAAKNFDPWVCGEEKQGSKSKYATLLEQVTRLVVAEAVLPELHTQKQLKETHFSDDMLNSICGFNVTVDYESLLTKYRDKVKGVDGEYVRATEMIVVRGKDKQAKTKPTIDEERERKVRRSLEQKLMQLEDLSQSTSSGRDDTMEAISKRRLVGQLRCSIKMIAETLSMLVHNAREPNK